MKILAVLLLFTSCGPINYMVKFPRANRSAVLASVRKMNKKTNNHHLKKYAATATSSHSIAW